MDGGSSDHCGGLPCLREGRSACLVWSMARGPDQHLAGLGGVDDVVDQAALGRVVGVHQLGLVLLDHAGPAWPRGRSAAAICRRKITLAAPSAPITAISLVGQA